MRSRDQLMQQWDAIRSQIASGHTSDGPRLWFEGVLDDYDSALADAERALAAEREACARIADVHALEMDGHTEQNGTIASYPMFPAHVHTGGASVELHADGSWSGDRDAFIAALKVATRGTNAVSIPILWLIANAIRRD